MIAGVWTSAEFRANSKSSSIFGKRKELLKNIEAALDEAHSRPAEQTLLALSFVERACKAWIDAHPDTSATPVSGKKLSNRRKAIEALQRQMKARREVLYAITPEERQHRAVVTSSYETSTKVLNIAPGDQDPRLMKGRAAFHQELLAKTIDRAKQLGHDKDDFNTEQLGYLAAKTSLNLDSVIDPKIKDRCRVEAMRVLCAMLGKNRQLAQQFEIAGIEVVVVPADRPMTDLPEFASLKDVDISQASGTPRTWNPTRGVGGLTVTTSSGAQKMYVAITEENLLGTNVGSAVAAIGGGCYEKRYSTTSHEFAHGLHIGGALTATQRATIERCFQQKQRARIDAANSQIIIDDLMLAPNQIALTGLFAKEWADGPRLRQAPLPAPKLYWVWKGGQRVMKPGGGYFQFSTRHELQDCYSAFDDREYFAQLVNCYLGSNGGTDPYTLRPRHNGEQWIRGNEPAEMVMLLDELFSSGTHAHFGQATVDDTNVDDGVDQMTVGNYIRARVANIKNQKLLASALQKRRAMLGYDDDNDA
jgi:hypothetical protein